MVHGGLRTRIWATTFVRVLPLMAVDVVIGLVAEGVSWRTPADVFLFLLVDALFSLVRAVHRARSLARWTRGLGLPVTEDLLRDDRAHTLTGTPFDRIRAELRASDRVFALAGADGGNPVRFRRRLRGVRRSAQASVTFDEALGAARVEVRVGEGLADLALFQGVALVALCQIVRTLEPADASGGTAR
ncbi:hypothetical protein ACWC24_01215 [Streptomyces sp. NPDC001443]